MSDAILITFDIDIGRPRARAVIVSAARAGEMPLIRACAFLERHIVADELYVQAVKRKPATPKVKAAKNGSPATPAKAEEPAVAETPEEPAVAETPAEPEPDQLVRPDEQPALLPEIEGDANG